MYGGTPGSRQGPTVLLYAHHDVQPPGRDELWTTPPFEPAERDGRLYGRGSSDDKAGVVTHAAALRAHEGKPPVAVKFLIEGEEETGSEHFTEFMSRYGDLLAADVLVVADSGNRGVGEPAITTSLRGVVDCVVEVRVLDHAVHSGMYGGPAADALTVLARTLATLHDEHGNVAIDGLVTGERPDVDIREDEFRRTAGMLPGVRLIGEGMISERVWTKPAVSVVGIDAPSIRESSNQLVPVARARVSLRIAPGQDPRRASAVSPACVEQWLVQGLRPDRQGTGLRRGKEGPGRGVRGRGRGDRHGGDHPAHDRLLPRPSGGRDPSDGGGRPGLPGPRRERERSLGGPEPGLPR